MISITFSWDDGANEDIRLMDLSLKYKMPGMFFIPATNPERGVMRTADIKRISDNHFEIGAHTYSHVYLDQVSLQQAEEELFRGKDFLEQLLGKNIPHFCFPGGKNNEELIKVSKKYFQSVRTADTAAVVKENSYIVKPTFHIYNRGKKSLLYNAAKNNSPVLLPTLKKMFFSDYWELIKYIICDMAESSEHYKIIIWGHSWELEKFKLWSNLEDLFDFIARNYSENVFNYSEFLKVKTS